MAKGCKIRLSRGLQWQSSSGCWVWQSCVPQKRICLCRFAVRAVATLGESLLWVCRLSSQAHFADLQKDWSFLLQASIYRNGFCRQLRLYCDSLLSVGWKHNLPGRPHADAKHAVWLCHAWETPVEQGLQDMLSSCAHGRASYCRSRWPATCRQYITTQVLPATITLSLRGEAMPMQLLRLPFECRLHFLYAALCSRHPIFKSPSSQALLR